MTNVYITIVIVMIFLHIVDDYYLQGLLIQLKQKEFWKQNAPDYMYRNDYIVGLGIHGFSWSFMIMLPIAFYYKFEITTIMLTFFVINAIIHSIIDHLKANEKIINLIQDQLLQHIYCCDRRNMDLITFLKRMLANDKILAEVDEINARNKMFAPIAEYKEDIEKFLNEKNALAVFGFCMLMFNFYWKNNAIEALNKTKEGE